MKKYLTLLLPFLALSFLVSGASAVQDKNAGLYPEIATKVIKVDKEFTIALESNPTTGYSWKANFDPKYVQLISSTYEPYKTAPGIVGSGGIQIFKFKAIKPGNTKITMQYLRPWENSPIKEKKYILVILRDNPFLNIG